MLSGYVLSVPSAVSLRRYRCSIPSHCRPSCTVSLLVVSVIGARFAFVGGGVSPGVWSRRGPWGVAVAPPILPYTGPGWSPPLCCVPLELRSVFYVLLCDIPPVFMVIIWSVSLTPACPLRVIPIRGCSLDTCGASDWLDLLSSSLYSRTLSFVLTCGHDSRALMHHAIDIVWRWPCLPRLRWL